MTVLASHDEQRKLIWAHVYQDLLSHAIPDSRFNLDFLSFTPDFRGSTAAIDRVLELPCYKNASTVLVTCDNSLERLRYRALKDGKRILVGTYRLRRGFVLLDPARINSDKFELAAALDGMEKSGIGRTISLAQMRDEATSIDLCVTGGLAFNQRGVVIWEGHALFEVQWALLMDMKVLGLTARVVAVAHSYQVVAETQLGFEEIKPVKAGEVQCDFVVTPEKVFEIEAAVKPTDGIDFDAVGKDALNNVPPLQELKGIRTMEKIMTIKGFGEEKGDEGKPSNPPSAEEQAGISIVDRLMKGYKA